MNYLGSATVYTKGCADTEAFAYLNYEWGEGSILFAKHKALKGIMEKVAIKRVILNASAKTGYSVVPIYQDTLNSLWNEKDLLTEPDAKALAIQYWEKRKLENANLPCPDLNFCN